MPDASVPTTSRSVAFKALSDVAGRAISFLTFPVIVRSVGADGYGAYGQVLAVVGLLVPFASGGLSSAVVRYFAGEGWSDRRRRTFLRISVVALAVALCAAGAMWLSAGRLNDLVLDWPGGTSLFRIGALFLVASALEHLLLHLLRARERLIHYSAHELAYNVGAAVGVFVLLPLGVGVTGLLAWITAWKAALLVTTPLMAGLHRSVASPAATEEDAGIREMVRYGLPLAVSLAGLWLMNLGDRLIIGSQLGADAVGTYTAIYAIATLLSLPNAAISLPAYPRIMAAFAADAPELAREVVSGFHRWLTLSLVPMAVLLAIVGAPLVELLSGDRMHPDPLVTGIVVFGLAIANWNGLAHYVVSGLDRTSFLQNSILVAGAANVVLNIPLVRWAGLLGAALVSLLTFGLLEARVLYEAARLAPSVVRYPLASLLRTLAACVAPAVASSTVLHFVEGWLGLATGVMVFGLLYLAGAFAFGEISGREVRTLWAAVRNR